jgi:hypothetical protein
MAKSEKIIKNIDLQNTTQKTKDWELRTPLWSGLNSGAPEERRHDHQPFMEIVLSTSIHK